VAFIVNLLPAFSIPGSLWNRSAITLLIIALKDIISGYTIIIIIFRQEVISTYFTGKIQINLEN
jgi:hypothetical protein